MSSCKSSLLWGAEECILPFLSAGNNVSLFCVSLTKLDHGTREGSAVLYSFHLELLSTKFILSVFLKMKTNITCTYD
jgi:hypothetical protein